MHLLDGALGLADLVGVDAGGVLAEGGLDDAGALEEHHPVEVGQQAQAGDAVADGDLVGRLAVVLAATVLSVAFATRGAMSSNRPIVEVLHFVGAKEAYIASQFQRHFLVLGLKGGIIGGLAAIAFLMLATVVYFFVVLPVNHLMARLRRGEIPPDPTTKKCPECMSEIAIGARRCAFCTSTVA